MILELMNQFSDGIIMDCTTIINDYYFFQINTASAGLFQDNYCSRLRIERILTEFVTIMQDYILNLQEGLCLWKPPLPKNRTVHFQEPMHGPSPR